MIFNCQKPSIFHEFPTPLSSLTCLVVLSFFLLSSCPYHHRIFSFIYPAFPTTPKLFLVNSFLILSNHVTQHIHLNILIFSSTSIFISYRWPHNSCINFPFLLLMGTFFVIQDSHHFPSLHQATLNSTSYIFSYSVIFLPNWTLNLSIIFQIWPPSLTHFLSLPTPFSNLNFKNVVFTLPILNPFLSNKSLHCSSLFMYQYTCCFSQIHSTF